MKALCVIAIMAFTAVSAQAALPEKEAAEAVQNYIVLAHKGYADSLDTAKKLQVAVDALLANPSLATLKEARGAWFTSRIPYGQTEGFRFYEGPIDFVNKLTGDEGPEARLNSWPLNEAYIDYVKGNEKAGIINDTSKAITLDLLKSSNQEKDEADVATGYHAIEFLLWGQDFSTTGPGDRKFTDYIAGQGNNDRRRDYLKLVTQLLVEDLTFLENEWNPEAKDNFATAFRAMPAKEAIGKIFTGITTLSGSELASERMSVPLQSGDQEDEHSCFSDNTHIDFIENAKSIQNVYGVLKPVVAKADPALDKQISAQLKITEKLVSALPHPVDTKILATPEKSPGRIALKAVIKSLQTQAKLFEKAGPALGVDVKMISEK